MIWWEMTVEQQLTIYRGTTRWLNYYSPSKFGHIFFVHPFKVQKSKSQKQSSHNSTVFENRPKSRIQHCERSELRLHWSIWQVLESNHNAPDFLKTCSLRSNLWKMSKLKNPNATFWVIFKQCAQCAHV